MTKYRAKKTEVDGIVFDSMAEAKRWCELKLLERAGEIRGLSRQIPLPVTVNGKLICKVVIDLAYWQGEQRIYEEIKSKFTRTLPVWRLKKKLVEAVYPNTELREVVR